MLLTYLQKDDANMAAYDIAGVQIPDSAMVRQPMQFIGDTESDLLFPTRVYLWGALVNGNDLPRMIGGCPEPARAHILSYRK
jgi:hypothetical protein